MPRLTNREVLIKRMQKAYRANNIPSVPPDLVEKMHVHTIELMAVHWERRAAGEKIDFTQSTNPLEISLSLRECKEILRKMGCNFRRRHGHNQFLASLRQYHGMHKTHDE